MISFKKIDKQINEKSFKSAALVIRHAEKDNSNLSNITLHGIVEIKILAERLNSYKLPINILSSPELRCMKTAEELSKYIQKKYSKIIVSDSLGKPGIQILDNQIYENLYAQFKCREIYLQWKNGKHLDALKDSQSLAIQAKQFLHSTYQKHGITIYISQSGTVAGIGYALGLTDYDIIQNEWVDYLDGFWYFEDD